MEAVAEAVMDMQAILLGNKTNVDEVEMWNIKGQYKFLPSSFFSSEAVTVHLTVILVILCG